MTKPIEITQLGKTYEIQKADFTKHILTVIPVEEMMDALGVENYDGSQGFDEYMEKMHSRLSSFADGITDIYWITASFTGERDISRAVQEAVNSECSFLVLDAV